MPGKRNFKKRIQILLDYYEEFGNLDIKQTDEYKGAKIGLLVANLRRERKSGKMLESDAEFLDSLGFQWHGKCTPEEKFPVLLDWLKIYGTLSNLTAYSKMEVNGKEINIGAVVAYFRRLNSEGRLSLVQKSYLKSIGFPFAELDEIYADMIDYYKRYGSLEKIKRNTRYVYNGRDYCIGQQLSYIICRFKEEKLSEEEYQFFNQMGAFDRWKKKQLLLYNLGGLSDELYRKYRLSEIDPDVVNKGV